MITTLVQFGLPQPITAQQAREAFLGSAERYRGVEGLIRKYYVLSTDGSTAGGMYLWRSREDADRMYTEEWKASVERKYGVAPSVIFFECPVVVDNLTDEITT